MNGRSPALILSTWMSQSGAEVDSRGHRPQESLGRGDSACTFIGCQMSIVSSPCTESEDRQGRLVWRGTLVVIHSQRNADVPIKRIFRFENLFNALCAKKIVSIDTTTCSFEHFSERGLANIEWQFQELNQFEAKSTELQSFRNLICTRFRHEILL